MSESRLVEAFRENERDLIHFLMLRLKSAFAAQDLAQELYVRVRNHEDTEEIRNGRAYLFRMAQNLAVDHLRKEARHAELQEEAGRFLNEGMSPATPERIVLAREELARMERALAELPPLTRKIFALSRFEEKPQREIAVLVGLSPAGVFKHIRRAMDHLSRARDGGLEE